MQNNRLSKEDEAAFVDSFFLPGGILDDFDEQGKEETTPDEQRFFVPSSPVSSNPWDAAGASALAATALPFVDRVANNDTTLETEAPWLGSGSSASSQSKPLRRPPGLLPEPDLLPSLLTPLPPEIERQVDNGLLQGLSVSHDLPSMMSHSPLETPATTTMDQQLIDISLGSSPRVATESPLLAPDSPLLAPGCLQNDMDFRQEHAIHDLLSNSSAGAATILPEIDNDIARLPAAVVEPTTAITCTTENDAPHDLQILGDAQVAISLTGNETIYNGSPLNEPTSPMDPIHVPTPQRQTPPSLDLQEKATSVSSVSPRNRDKTRLKDTTYDSESSTKDGFASENGSSVPKASSDVVEEKLSAADSEKRGRTNISKLGTQSSRANASVSSTVTDEDKRSIPTTKKRSSSSDQLETRRRGTSTTGVSSKIPFTVPRVSLPILRFFEDAMITLFKWLASAIHGVFDAYEILVLVFRHVFMIVGYLGVAVAKYLYLVACGLRNVGKYAMEEARHSDGSAMCYLTLYLTPRMCSLLMIIVDLPQYAPHVLSHILIFVLCRQPEPDVLIIHHADSKTRYESSGINERHASDICAVILRTIRILLPLNFIWDAFDKEISTFLSFGGPVRMLLAFLLALVRGRLILSPVAWVSWSAQVLATAYCPRGLVLDGSLLLWGLASIHLVRSLDSDNIIRLHNTKFLHEKKSS